ncbi:TIGR03087 family PEP-CTERM/XrtA system glycosyltransferase [candidate division KSB1 bacterium]|nr:MAG: TIGR03087 family PEP-CTERM/XrtA system glycosyltransferase [candidate division KSB1 bacterium]
MRILFLTPRLPFPPVGGDKLRVFNFIKHLSRNHKIALISFIADPDEANYLIEYASLLERVKTVLLSKEKSYSNACRGILSPKPFQIHYYYLKKMRQLIFQEIESGKYDLVFVHLIRMAEYVKDLRGVPRILDLTDAISLNYERSVRYRRDVFYLVNLIEKEKVRRYETEIISHFEKNLLISSVDKNYLSRYTDNQNIEIVPNGVDIDYFQFYDGVFDLNRVVFLGNMRTFPNSDAVEYFCKEILPLIRKELPKVKFHIIGSEPSKVVRKLASEPEVVVTGYVKDVRPFLRKAAVSVCPMRVGAGIQNKILESMAMGTPVVSTPEGVEGIEVNPGQEILVSNSSSDFAQKVTELIQNRALRRSISLNARRLVEKKYTWEITLNQLEHIITEVVGRDN